MANKTDGGHDPKLAGKGIAISENNATVFLSPFRD
jgi:hypothetical protein